MFDNVKKRVKGRVPAGWRGPGAFGTEWVGIGLRRMVKKVFEESHTPVFKRCNISCCMLLF